MKVLIIGAGEVGSHLSALLSDQGHDVTVVDTQEQKVNRIDEEMNVRVIHGSGSSAETLKKANVSNCAFFLALTSDDETNLISCSLAKAMGAQTTLCRIHDQTFSDTSYLNYQMHFGIDHLINPEGLCAVELAKSIRSPGRVAVENFARGQIEVQQILISEKSSLIGKSLKDLSLGNKVKIGLIQRGETFDVPTANTMLASEDLVTVFGTPDRVFELRSRLEPDRINQHVRIVLFGGGETARALLRLLSNPRFHVRVIENDAQQCRYLAEKFPAATIIHGDGTSLRLMEEEEIGHADYFIACTKDDENNIVTGLQASKLGARHVQAVINKSDYDEVLDNLKAALGVETIISPRTVTANEVLHLISTTAYIELGELRQKQVKVLEFRIREKSPITGKTLREIKFPQHCVMAALQHRYEARVPSADDCIEPGDRIVMITHEENIPELVALMNPN
jgi:trk system potassium uptake protein TrkA